ASKPQTTVPVTPPNVTTPLPEVGQSSIPISPSRPNDIELGFVASGTSTTTSQTGYRPEMLRSPPPYGWEEPGSPRRWSVSSEIACPVCLEDFVGGEYIRELPCGHLFHPLCIDPWLWNNSLCPTCRTDAALVTVDLENEDGK
ncbi:hypothetical protein HDU67_008308, partial [Dinochytrium kinnereticum]